MSRWFDQKIIVKLEKVTHWYQIRYDRDNFFIARRLLLLSGILTWLLNAYMLARTVLQDPDLRTASPMIAFIVALVFLGVIFAVLIPVITWLSNREIRRMEQAAWQAAEQGLRNPAEIKEFGWRVFFITPMVLFCTYFIPECTIWYIGMWFSEYFCAVTPLHPNEVARQKEKRAVAKQALQPALTA